MSVKLTILGCGSSAGVPRIGGDWGACDPSNSKNRRRRCSVLLERTSGDGITRVLVDTSPDMREQMLDAKVPALDGVWYTHEHADHTHGIDELRAFYLLQRKRIPIWADHMTASMLQARFAYCFASPVGSDYPPIVSLTEIKAGHQVETIGAGGAVSATPFIVHHGNIDALGYRIGDVAYTPDLNAVPDRSLQYLENLDVWVVDALRRTPHPSHFSLRETLVWIERMKPKRAVLTNLHIDLDYETLCQELPPHIRPAFDGMIVDIH
jgi:phosphoribosyl 1,2-cyclic phosphate phosphodiesterase